MIPNQLVVANRIRLRMAQAIRDFKNLETHASPQEFAASLGRAFEVGDAYYHSVGLNIHTWDGTKWIETATQQ